MVYQSVSSLYIASGGACVEPRSCVQQLARIGQCEKSVNTGRIAQNSADNLDLRDNLASAVDLENHHNQTLANPTTTACKNKSRPREAVKFNDPHHRAAANDVDLRNRAARGSVCNGWFGDTSRAMMPTKGYRPVSHDAEL